jgi:hypothetical protein
MIERSHRRKTPKAQPDPEVLLRLHERLASQRLWFFRLLIASGLALAVSFVLWLVRVSLVWHLIGIALGFIAGLFIQRSMKSWALTWIRERSGLSYETALEQHHKDDFGFSHSVRERAAQEASRLPLPRYQAWWLPMLAVALGLAFLPLIPSVTNLPTALTTQPAQTTLPEVNQPANTTQPSEPQTTSQPVAEPPQEGQAPSQDTGETDTSQLDSATGSSASPNANNQSADEQALDQFLDNLRQNEQPQEQAPDVDLSSVMQPSSGNGQPSNEENASRPRNEQVNPFEQAGNNQNGEAQQNSEAQQGQEQQAAEDAAQNGEGEEGQNAQAQQSESQSNEGQTSSQGESPQGAEQQGSEQQNQGQQGEGQGEQQGEQGQEGAGESGMNAEGQQEGQSDSGQNAEGAGSLAGTPTGQSADVAGSSQQNPDFLPGQLSEGPNNVAGTARLPGETEEIIFPEGSAPGSFSRAEEEALTEGRIPLEYQEVIRNYFGNE